MVAEKRNIGQLDLKKVVPRGGAEGLCQTPPPCLFTPTKMETQQVTEMTGKWEMEKALVKSMRNLKKSNPGCLETLEKLLGWARLVGSAT